VTHLTLQQQIGGVEVFRSAMTIHLNREGAVIASGGELISGAAQAINLAEPKIAAVEALRSAAEQAGAEAKERPEMRVSPGGADARQEFASGQSFGQDVKARPVYFPLAANRARLAWEFVIWMSETPDAYLILIDAEQKTLLIRHNLTNYEENPLRPHGGWRKQASSHRWAALATPTTTRSPRPSLGCTRRR
jgi:Zn-dependent metalloprotease